MGIFQLAMLVYQRVSSTKWWTISRVSVLEACNLIWSTGPSRSKRETPLLKARKAKYRLYSYIIYTYREAYTGVFFFDHKPKTHQKTLGWLIDLPTQIQGDPSDMQRLLEWESGFDLGAPSPRKNVGLKTNKKSKVAPQHTFRKQTSKLNLSLTGCKPPGILWNSWAWEDCHIGVILRPYRFFWMLSNQTDNRQWHGPSIIAWRIIPWRT